MGGGWVWGSEDILRCRSALCTLFETAVPVVLLLRRLAGHFWGFSISPPFCHYDMCYHFQIIHGLWGFKLRSPHFCFNHSYPLSPFSSSYFTLQKSSYTGFKKKNLKRKSWFCWKDRMHASLGSWVVAYCHLVCEYIGIFALPGAIGSLYQSKRKIVLLV